MPQTKRGGVVSGVGKDSRRTDKLNATPGLTNSSLQQGDVQKFEQGQKAVQTTRGSQPAAAGAAAPPSQDLPISVPDPVDFAVSRSNSEPPQVPTGPINAIDTADWIPLMQKLAGGNASSGRLKVAFREMLARTAAEPFETSSVLIDAFETEDTVLNAFEQ